MLVVGSSSNPFGRYYAEILRAEGLNAFTATDVSLLTSGLLSNYDVVVLGEVPLTAAQVTALTDWVRPEEISSQCGQTSSSLGCSGSPRKRGRSRTHISGSPDNSGRTRHRRRDDSVSRQRQPLHGRQRCCGCDALRHCAAASSNPAVTLRSVGPNGGQAAAFAFDLARSVVLTRQGNTAWSGQERDGIAGIRSDDLFYPDWVDLTKVAIPQADEQQRLLVNLIEVMNADRKPLPRFWYFPRGEKAVVVMTGDDHGSGNPAGRFELLKQQDPASCSVVEWECVRGTA